MRVERLEDRAVLAVLLPTLDVTAANGLTLAPSTTTATALVTPRFSANNTTIAAAIAKVPTSVGPLTSVSVVDFGTTVYTGSLDVTNTLNRIRAGGRSISTNDGAVYSNAGGALSPRTGTWFEFVVDPRTGTNRSFTSVASPGPMRVVLNTDGTTYFTGNHYSTFVSMWKPGTAPVLSIGTLTASPSSVVTGGSFSLAAANVTATGSTVTGVKFYRDTNGVAGLQVGGDTLVGNGTQSGSTWTFPTNAGSLASGSYTFYAVASDAANVSSAPVSTVLTVTIPPKPVIGSFAVSPGSIVVGGTVTLTASNVTAPAGSVSGVTFFRETNGIPGLQAGADSVVGAGGRAGTTTTWTLATSTANLAPGSATYYAMAADSAGSTSLVAAAVLALTSPATPATPSVSIAAASGLEGQSGTRSLTFLVALSAPATAATTVGYRTSDITATAGTDYAGVTSGTLTFRAGQRTASIVIQVFGDATVEADETFQVELLNPVNARLGIATAEGTILNDDVIVAAALALQPTSRSRATSMPPVPVPA